jgi:hypothetical protein
MYTLATNHEGVTTMVNKITTEQKKGKVKVGKLKLNKGSVKELSSSQEMADQGWRRMCV